MADEDTSWHRGWRARGDNTPVNHYEFYAVIDPLVEDIKEVREDINRIEDRLIDERAKHFLVDLFVTGTGRFFLVIAGLAAAFALNWIGFNPFG